MKIYQDKIIGDPGNLISDENGKTSFTLQYDPSKAYSEIPIEVAELRKFGDIAFGSKSKKL